MVLKRKKKKKKKKKGKNTYFPELLRGILARYTLKNLCAAGVLVDKVGYIENIAVDDDVEALIGSLVVGHFSRGERFRHFEVECRLRS